MSYRDRMEELHEWLMTLPPDFALLLALPFVIATVAVAWDAIRSLRERHQNNPHDDRIRQRPGGRAP